MNRPTRTTTAGRAYLDLQNLARRTNRPTDELHQLYALEGFLARLAISPHHDKLVLKGGVLLAAYDARRPTRDVDLQGQNISNEVDDVLKLVRAVTTVTLDDGLTFEPRSTTAEPIRDEDTYSGVRVNLIGTLSRARLTFHVDVNVGDPVSPAPQIIAVPRLLGGDITLPGYPLPMILAEKIVTAVQRGTVNTRWRDYADIYILSHRHTVEAQALDGAITKVASHRQAELGALATILEGYAALAQSRWLAWRRRQRLEDTLPTEFTDVLNQVIALADPVLLGAPVVAWNPQLSRWSRASQ